MLTLTAEVIKLQICKEITDNKNIEELKKNSSWDLCPKVDHRNSQKVNR